MVLAGPLLLASEDATAALAAALAPRLRAGDVLLLDGPVGAGKSAFARALIRARLGEPEAEVPSPTFTLVQTYGEPPDLLWHADLYRLGGPAEVAETGLLAAMEEAISLVEWPDRLGALAPASALVVGIEPVGEASRRITFSGPPDWAQRLRGLDAA